MSRDDLYRRRPPAPFEFSDEVVRVFPDMIERSVPGYRQLLELTPLLVQQAAQPDTRIYDLGCSLGAATLAARRAVRADGVQIIGIDNSPEMVERCRKLIAADNSRVPVRIEQGDIREVAIENASVVMLYFTLQFVPPAARDALIGNIFNGLRPGGVLLLAEKFAFDDVREQQWMDRHHEDFKRAQGYSDLEIARKRQALENVLVPETREQHRRRLQAAGFDPVIDWFVCFNFGCLAAIRPD
ncbi:MAG: carboxy-S-adenosyl-L-methionine synthase CmoA [Wenzhouxiangellaceae bacterium]